MKQQWLALGALMAMNAAACDDAEPANGGNEVVLVNCDTDIADGAPEFFKTYFRCVTISMDGDNVVIESKGLPPHPSAYYGDDHPNYAAFDTSRGGDYRQNPNVIQDQNIALTIPLSPTESGIAITAALVDGAPNTTNEEYPLGPAGVAIDSVALFNPLAAPGDDIEDEKFTFDDYNGHPEMNGAYHYHTNTAGPLEVLADADLVTSTTPGEAEVELYGIMCDGTLVLGCTELDGTAPDDGGFDAQNGHVHDVENADASVSLAARYHTHICPGTLGSHEFTPEIMYYATCKR